MHVVVGVQVVDSLANIPEITSDKGFAELSIAEFDFLVQWTPWCELEDHVGRVFIFFVVVVEEFNDVGMVEFMMDVDFLLGVFIVDLSKITEYHFDGNNLSVFSVASQFDLSVGPESYYLNLPNFVLQKLVALVFH